MRSNIIASLISIIVTFGMIEGLLRVTDPLGAHQYFTDLGTLNIHAVPSGSGYTYHPGAIRLSDWAATIGADGNRVMPVPDNPQCRVAIIGDSVSFGFGVEDSEAWPYLVAQTYPDITFINTAKNGYNAGNFARVVRANPADEYIYLAIANDGQAPAEYQKPYTRLNLLAASKEYLWTTLVNAKAFGDQPDNEALIYLSDGADFLKRPDVLIFTIEGNIFNTGLLTIRPDTTVIPLWTSNNSISDPHPDAVGHRQIADQIIPHLDGLCSP